jgi:hypothetical protein
MLKHGAKCPTMLYYWQSCWTLFANFWSSPKDGSKWRTSTIVLNSSARCPSSYNGKVEKTSISNVHCVAIWCTNMQWPMEAYTCHIPCWMVVTMLPDVPSSWSAYLHISSEYIPCYSMAVTVHDFPPMSHSAIYLYGVAKQSNWRNKACVLNTHFYVAVTDNTTKGICRVHQPLIPMLCLSIRGAHGCCMHSSPVRWTESYRYRYT